MKAAHIERNRPENIQWDKVRAFLRFGSKSANRQHKKEVDAMPRMSKYLKREWAFFLDERGRKKYNALCRKCEMSCKQSFRAVVIQCPHYQSKGRQKTLSSTKRKKEVIHDEKDRTISK